MQIAYEYQNGFCLGSFAGVEARVPCPDAASVRNKVGGLGVFKFLISLSPQRRGGILIDVAAAANITT